MKSTGWTYALIFSICLASLTAAVSAQTTEASSEFEVASIRLSKPSERRGVWTDGSPNQIRMLGMNLKQLMTFAYDVESYRIDGSGVLPPESYDVIAKIPEDTVRLPDEARWARIRLMTRALLSSRFKLSLHLGSTEMAVYRLVVAKGGSKIRELGPNPGDNVVVNRRQGHLSAEQMPMSQFIGILRGELKRPVLDATGIRGVFDVELDWAPANVRDATATPDNRPSLFTVIGEKLGLKLVPAKTAIDVLVVDHAEKASEN